MHKLKFISVMQTLSAEEFKDFAKFIKSPYYNSNRNIVAAYNILKPHYPSFDAGKIPKEKFYSKLYPGKKYSVKQMEKLSSEMLGLAEEFIMLQRLKSDEFTRSYYTLQELNSRKLFSLFSTRLKPVKEKFENAKVYDEYYFLNKYRLEREIVYYLNNTDSSPFLLNDNAQNIADNLVKYFLVNIQSIYSYMINQSKNAYDYSFRMDFFEHVKKYIEEGSFSDVPYIEMFYNSMMLLLHGKEENFRKLRKIVSEHYDKINKVDRLNMYTVLTNYCFRQYNLGKDEYLRVDFEIYNEILNRGAYQANYYLHHLHYKNIVNCALGLKEFEWTENFIKSYQKYLTAEHRDSAFYLCRALLDFACGNYETTLELLAKVNMEDITYKFDTKCLVAQVYYELKEYESFYSLADTYRHMLTKNKLVPAKNKEQHLQFIKFIVQLNKLREENQLGEEHDLHRVEEIKQELILSESVKNKRWLLNKISEFETN